MPDITAYIAKKRGLADGATRGPWQLHPFDEIGGHDVYVGDEFSLDRVIAAVGNHPGKERSTVNARLIAHHDPDTVRLEADALELAARVVERDPWELGKAWSDGSWNIKCRYCYAEGFLPYAGEPEKDHKEGCLYESARSALDALARSVEGQEGDRDA